MCKKIMYFLVCLCGFIPREANGQVDSFHIDSILIVGQTLNIQDGNPGQQSFDLSKTSHLSSQGLDQIVNAYTSTYIKNNGSGTLSTASMRGGSSAQSMVLWNGLPIGNSMLGLLDLSHIPVFFVDLIKVDYGGDSGFSGSGSISGKISLNALREKEGGLSSTLGAEAGSFGHLAEHASIKWSDTKWSLSSRILNVKSENDFTYNIPNTDLSVTQEHGDYEQLGWTNSLFFTPVSKHQFALHTWSLRHHVNIPPTIVQNKSVATQEDINNRYLASYKFVGDDILFDTKLGVVSESIDYQDSLQAVSAQSNFSQLYSEMTLQKNWSQDSKTFLSITFNRLKAFAQEYKDEKIERRYGWIAAHQVGFNGWRSRASLRQDFLESTSAYVPSFSVHFSGWKQHVFHLSIERSYRFPTMNDRYWIPGGNLDLMPEQGWNKELGYKSNFEYSSRWTSDWYIGLYHRKMTNWILWTKLSDQFFWSPQNIASVTSKGYEIRYSNKMKIGVTHQNINLSYNYNSAQNDIPISLPIIDKGQQLFYVPIHNWNGSYGLNYKNFALIYRQNYTGSVIGINKIVEGYWLGHLETKMGVNFGSLEMNVSLHLNNLWNKSYQVIENRAMPGRNVKIGFQTTF